MQIQLPLCSPFLSRFERGIPDSQVCTNVPQHEQHEATSNDVQFQLRSSERVSETVPPSAAKNGLARLASGVRSRFHQADERPHELVFEGRSSEAALEYTE